MITAARVMPWVLSSPISPIFLFSFLPYVDVHLPISYYLSPDADGHFLILLTARCRRSFPFTTFCQMLTVISLCYFLPDAHGHFLILLSARCRRPFPYTTLCQMHTVISKQYFQYSQALFILTYDLTSHMRESS